MTNRLGAVVAVMLATGCGERTHVATIAGGDVERGRAVLEQFDCGACHDIPGVRGPRSRVGPPLAGLRERAYVAGRFENSPEVLARWLLDPPAMKPETAMPALGLSEAQARDATAYLYSLE
jgi:cytochrome c2